jgi:ABC-type sugar transport system ATPase subunit
LGLSDRILVFRRGRIVEQLSPDEAMSEAVIFAAAYGAAIRRRPR